MVCTVVCVRESTKPVLCSKWGHFDRAKIALKILLVLLVNIKFVKEVQVFPKSYCGSLYVNWLQSYKLSKLEVWKKFCLPAPIKPHTDSPSWTPGQQDHPSFLTACNFVASWPTDTHSTSLERSKPSLLTQSLFKSLKALLMYFIFVESNLISIGVILFSLDLSV